MGSGIGLFAGGLFTYDFAGNAFHIERGELTEPGGAVVAYTYRGQIQFDIDVAGQIVPVHLDSGSPGTLTVLDHFDTKLPLVAEPVAAGMIQTPMGGAAMRTATLDGTLRFAGHEFTNPVISFADLPPMLAHEVGNLGSELLKSLAVTFDQQRKRLRFARAIEVGGSPAATSRPRSIGVQLAMKNGSVFTVAGLVPAAAGERAGLRAGDALLEVNGEPMTQDGLRAALRGSKPVLLTIERDGERETVTLFVE